MLRSSVVRIPQVAFAPPAPSLRSPPEYAEHTREVLAAALGAEEADELLREKVAVQG